MAMEQEQGPQDLRGLLDQVRSAGGDPETVTVADIRERLGRRSFGPLLLFAGLVLSTPLAGIPGLPSAFAVIIMLTAGQMLVGLEGLWLPRFLLRRSISRHHLERFDGVVRYVARYVDKIIRPRWFYLTAPPFSTVIAGLCVLLGLIMLPLEYVPLTSSIPAFPVAAFGLALTSRDGLFVIVGLASILAGIGAFLMVGRAIL
jgi:hypothetical protein